MQFMDFINKPLGWILSFISNYMAGKNYLLAILIFAIFVEIVLLPFGIIQQKKSIKQARLRPKELAIRKKYSGRDDKATQMKMNEEIQELYQKEGYNPMSGCLPLLIQFPLLIALYNVVIDPLKYICGLSTDSVNQIKAIVGASSNRGTMDLLTKVKDVCANNPTAFDNVEGWNADVIGKMPDLTVFKVFDLSVTPQQCLNLESIKTVAGWLILLVPVFTFVAYFFSMKLNRKFSYQPMNDASQAQMGCSNNIMDIVMPLFSVFLAFTYPAALGLYWIFKCLLGLLKQFILSKAMPLPVFTDEDYKEAEREVNARAEKHTKVQKSGRVVRSLHHIDDEDFEDTAEKARAFKEALAAQEEAEKKAAEEAKKNAPRFGGFKLKDDSDKNEKKSKKKSDKAEENKDSAQSEGKDEQ